MATLKQFRSLIAIVEQGSFIALADHDTQSEVLLIWRKDQDPIVAQYGARLIEYFAQA